MRTTGPTTLTVPKAALLAVALAGGITVASVDAHPALAKPSYQQDCTGCHGGGTVSGTVSAVPSVTTAAPGAPYAVAITAPRGSGPSGYWIARSDAAGATGASTGVYAGPSSTTSFTATMTAPATAGTYAYKVWAATGKPGVTGFALYSITVAAGPTPPARPHLARVSPARGRPGTLVTVTGSGFRRAGVVRFAGVRARVTSWRASRIVVRVPATVRPGRRALVVTPAGAARSNAKVFTVLRRVR